MARVTWEIYFLETDLREFAFRNQSLTLINLIKSSLKLFICCQIPLQIKQVQTEAKEFRSIKPFFSVLSQDTFDFQCSVISNLLYQTAIYIALCNLILQSIVFSQIFVCGEPIERQIEDSTLTCLVLPTKNIYLPHINLLAQVKMRIGKKNASHYYFSLGNLQHHKVVKLITWIFEN